MPRLTAKQLQSSSSINTVLIGLYECYNFLTNNEYSDKTIGLFAFILRKSVGDINFSYIINEVEKRNQQWQSANFVELLKDIRTKLPNIEASIEKCLIINRLIIYIEEDSTRFQSIISSIQRDIIDQMTDNKINQTINYPEDFRQREKDFIKRKNTQNIRRLFYLSPTEAKAPSLIDLQNRTTLYLTYIIDHRMKYDLTFQQTGLEEIINIFSTSFMILVQPQYSVNPVLIYDRKGPGKNTAKVSVIIISLLNDFMETHPNMIQLDPIELSLWPLSPHYKLAEPRLIPWKTRQLQLSPGEKSRTVKYAELSEITIQQARSINTAIRLGELLHTLNFSIKLRMNLTEPNISKIYQIPIESLPFAIGTNTSQIPHYLTRVIIDDIRRFSQIPSIDVTIMMNFLSRYFIHRTGVEPKQGLRIYLEEELTKAKNARNNFQRLEDIYMDFLVPFVHRVEFMGKHPVLAMCHVDGLFLGPCNSEQADKIMMEPSDANLPIVTLRFNSIRIDYNSSIRAKKDDPCYVRVVIYNTIKQHFIPCTFNSAILAEELFKFVSCANDEKANNIFILSGFDDKTNIKTFNYYKAFNKYYHDQLKIIAKTDPNYKDITDLFNDIEDDNGSHVRKNPNMNSSENNLHSILLASTATINHKDGVSGYMSIHSDQTNTDQKPLQNGYHPSNQELLDRINDEDMIQYIRSRPTLLEKLFSSFTISSPMVPIQQQTQLQMHYSNQQIPLPYQQQSSPVPFQIQLQQPSSSIIPHQPTNVNVCQQWPVYLGTQTFQTSENGLTSSNLSSDDLDSINSAELMESLNEYNQESFDNLNLPENSQ